MTRLFNAVPFVIVDLLAHGLANVAVPDPAIVTVEVVLDAINQINFFKFCHYFFFFISESCCKMTD